MQIAVLSKSADTRATQTRSEVMLWFEAAARALLLAIVVLIGAAVVRNVTDALTAATYGHAPEQTSTLAMVSR
jgi:hypothetical protein